MCLALLLLFGGAFLAVFSLWPLLIHLQTKSHWSPTSPFSDTHAGFQQASNIISQRKTNQPKAHLLVRPASACPKLLQLSFGLWVGLLRSGLAGTEHTGRLTGWHHRPEKVPKEATLVFKRAPPCRFPDYTSKIPPVSTHFLFDSPYQLVLSFLMVPC